MMKAGVSPQSTTGKEGESAGGTIYVSNRQIKSVILYSNAKHGVIGVHFI